MTLPKTRRRGARSALLAPLVAAGLVAGLAVGPTAQAAAPSRSGIYFGVAGDQQTARSKTSENLAGHSYGYFERKVPDGRMLSVRFQNNPPWRNTAALKSGSTGHQQIVKWADTLKARGSEVLVAFHHEPEATGNKGFGTAEEYKAAYRKVVEIFRSRGANNVVFTWQMTAYAFVAESSAYNAAAKWYPGDAYVDVVAADPYNWYNCGHGRGKWKSLAGSMDSVIDFARARGKQVAVGEYGSVRDARRPAWIRDAGKFLAANDDIVVAAFYFNRAPTNRANADCTWTLTSSEDFAALREVARMPVMKH